MERVRRKFPTLLPTKKRGRPTGEEKQRKRMHMEYFANEILKLKSTLDFPVSARGWCYILEGKGIITKGEFSDAEKLINDCRKSGLLPIDICAEDAKRSTSNILYQTLSDIEMYLGDEREKIFNYLINTFQPILPHDFQSCYIEMGVEKIDLVGLFSPVCQHYGVPITNLGGWGDLNSRTAILRRFAEYDDRRMVLLYCGDFDPGGLIISDTLRKNFTDMETAAKCRGLTERIEIVKFGLDYDFIEENGLTWIENLETSSGNDLGDPNHPDHNKPYVQDYIARYGVRKCEANALVVNVGVGRELCQSTILHYVDPDEHDKYLRTITEQRSRLSEYLNGKMF
jgi:hypothetical protein